MHWKEPSDSSLVRVKDWTLDNFGLICTQWWVLKFLHPNSSWERKSSSPGSYLCNFQPLQPNSFKHPRTSQKITTSNARVKGMAHWSDKAMYPPFEGYISNCRKRKIHENPRFKNALGWDMLDHWRVDILKLWSTLSISIGLQQKLWALTHVWRENREWRVGRWTRQVAGVSDWRLHKFKAKQLWLLKCENPSKIY